MSRADGRTGVAEVTIAPGATVRRCLARRSDLVLYVLAGTASGAAGGAGRRTVGPGELAVFPRGRPWEIRSCGEEVRLLAFAVPAGPEAVLRALTQAPALDDATLLPLAVDGGVELLLDPLEACSSSHVTGQRGSTTANTIPADRSGDHERPD